MRNGQTISIDFDGVIHAYSKGWYGGALYDVAIDGAFAAIKKLQNKGFNVVIFTARDKDQHADIIEWCIAQAGGEGLTFAEVKVTNQKPIAIAYIDDRGIRFTNWKDMLNYF